MDGDELTVSATTSTNQVVPSVDGMELTLTPAKDFVGTVSVNVFVTDGSLTDTVSYQLTVLNINDAPVLFEIKDQVVKVKDMASGAEQVVPITTIINHLKPRADQP